MPSVTDRCLYRGKEQVVRLIFDEGKAADLHIIACSGHPKINHATDQQSREILPQVSQDLYK